MDDAPFTVFEGQVCATLMCHCRLGNTPMLITNTNLIIMCRFCKATYAIVQAEYIRPQEGGLGEVRVVVGRGEPKTSELRKVN